MRSVIWGNKDFPISQEFGACCNPQMYAYAAAYGYPAGTHIGLDVAMPNGTPIYSYSDGKVIEAGFSDYFRPEPVWVQQDDGTIIIYGHLRKAAVKKGDTVKRGTLLGYSGEQTVRGTYTPDGTGPHLHLEIRVPTNNGYRAVDPEKYVEQDGGTTSDTTTTDSTSSEGISLPFNAAVFRFIFIAFVIVLLLGAIAWLTLNSGS